VTNRFSPVTRETDLLIYRLKKTAAHQNYDDTQSFSTRTVRVKYSSEGQAKEFDMLSLTRNGERLAADASLPSGAIEPEVISGKVSAATEAAWKPFFERVKTAVKKRDRRTLRTLMSEISATTAAINGTRTIAPARSRLGTDYRRQKILRAGKV